MKNRETAAQQPKQEQARRRKPFRNGNDLMQNSDAGTRNQPARKMIDLLNRIQAEKLGLR